MFRCFVRCHQERTRKKNRKTLLKSVQKVGALHTFLQISHDLVKKIKQMRPCWKDIFKWDNMIIKIFQKH